MNFKNMWNRLTSNYKRVGGNIEKLLIIIDESVSELVKNIKKLLDIHSLEKSMGEDLDRIGAEEKEQRRGRTDEDYKSAIRFEISRKKAAEDVNSINTALEFYLKDSFEYVEEGNAAITIVASRFFAEEEKEKIKTLSAAGIATKFRTEQKLEKAKVKIAIMCLSGEEVTI